MSSSSESIPKSGSSSEMSSDDSVEFFVEVVQQLHAYTDTASSTRHYVRRDRNAALELLMADYFDEYSTYTDAQFRETFRVPKRLFLEIVQRIESSGRLYFQEGYDGRGDKSFTALQKCMVAMQQLADGGPAAQLDKYFKMAGRTARECLQHFCDAVCDIYGPEYLRKPTAHDIAVLQVAHEQLHHIPGMLGSVDCTHLEWRQCPKSLQGQYKRGTPGSNNDINVLNTSPLFLRDRNGTAPSSSFVVNGNTYKRGYYLADGGYPDWSTFVKAYSWPTDPKEKKFKKLQESARKDVERAFGALKGRWGILNRTQRSKSKDRIQKIVYTCIILHNMLIREDSRAICPVHIMDQPVNPVFDDTVLPELRDENVCAHLRYDLTEHVAVQDLPYLELEDY